MNKKTLVMSILAILVVGAAASGMYLIKNKYAKDKNGQNPVAVQKDGAPTPAGRETGFEVPEETGDASAVISTKAIFQKIPRSTPGRLVRIVFRSRPSGAGKEPADTLTFYFYDDTAKKTFEANYDYASGTFFKGGSSAQPKGTPETVPASAIELGHEGMRNALENSTEFLDYRTKYSDLAGNCTDVLAKDSRFGWEWRTSCRASVGGKNALVVFATNVETRKVSVVRSENFE